MFDTKVAIIVLSDLVMWQKLNVTAFLATGIAGAAPEAMGEPYDDSAGRLHARLLGQPIIVFAADPDGLARAWRVAPGKMPGLMAFTGTPACATRTAMFFVSPISACFEAT